MDVLVSEDFGEYFRFVVTAVAGAAAFIWANRRDALDLKELEVLSGLRASYKDAEDQSPVNYMRCIKDVGQVLSIREDEFYGKFPSEVQLPVQGRGRADGAGDGQAGR